VSDAQGRFALSRLVPGAYDVTASKAGYVRLSYGQRRIFETAIALTLAPGATLNLSMTLPRSGVIVAKVVDATGEPLVGFDVSVLRRRFEAGRLVLVNASPYRRPTDDRGEVRLFGLDAGEYYVSARPGVSDFLRNPPRAEGETFFPSTLVADSASPVRVSAGVETTVVITAKIQRLAHITGSIFDSAGAPVTGGSVTMTSYQSNRTGGVPLNRLANGSFAATGLGAGEYVLRVRTDGLEYAEKRFVVAGDDVDGVIVRTMPGATIRGRVLLDDPGATSVDPTALRLRVVGTSLPQSKSVTSIRDDGSFEAVDVTTEGVLRVDSPSGDWFVKHVWVEGRDVADLPVDFHARQTLRDVQIVLTKQVAKISGTALSGRPGEVGRFVAVLFPPDPAFWTAHSRLIAATASDQDGRFEIDGMLSGDYLIAAIESLERGAERDPEVLALLAQQSQHVSLRAGASATVSLRIVEP
jgi:hypothetical protein